ncbi:peptidoglycan D,D-transpeptidase FtsI family protein [Mycetocola saprophilus]|uniref:peptidoglycan D,D-transpeptidase FtsI family protein n=1 Tax=Mycetocola saprophilus TaxID=76636 RepID=UPI0004C1B637|nr:penicillin-binding protein 2 [Mycetocola saprophilus]
MHKELRRVGAVVVLMFAALFVSSTVIQGVQSDALGKDPRNTRTRYDSYQVERGPIVLADGTIIAQSVPSNDEFRYQREYPQGPLYAGVTGYFNPIQGATGIEQAMNDYLTGTSSDQFLTDLARIVNGQPARGARVELSIQSKVQQAASEALGNRRGAVVAIEPKTGKILAMVTNPTFDPNGMASHNSDAVSALYKDLLANPLDPLINRAIGGNLNPPGSSFKVIVAAAALASGEYTAESEFPNPQFIELPGTSTKVYNFTREACGPGETVTLAEAIRQSCNVPMAELGIRLGADKIREQAEKFGFNTPLDVPLRVEPSVYPKGGDVPSTALSAFGQWDVRASPMQMAMVSAGIGNGGVMMKPNLVNRVIAPNLDVVKSFDPEKLRTVVTPDQASELTKMMIAAVATGQSNNARIEGVDVAGKTGTAQNGVDDPYTLWFTGFAPAQNPEVAVAVVVENDGDLGHHSSGNIVSSPIAKKVIEAVLNK